MSGSEGTFIYSPGVSVVIESTIGGFVDVTADCSAGSVTLRENGAHNATLTIENQNRKYDGYFVPNDRISISMKRLTKWLPVFTGYLDRSPYFSTYPRSIQISAQCTLKVLRNWPWDRGSTKAAELIAAVRDIDAQDGGMRDIIVRIMTEVTNWPAERIHIGKVPAAWFDKFERIYKTLDDEIKMELEPLLGTNPLIAGQSWSGSFSSPIVTTGGSVTANASDAQLEAVMVTQNDVDIVLQTIRFLESSNNYSAAARGSTASGAYQFIDSTWGNYRGFRRAKDAPPPIQDEKARANVTGIMARYGHKLINIPYIWYIGHLPTEAELNAVPKPSAGNVLTPKQYAYKWVRQYLEFYSQARGGPPPSYQATPATTHVVTPQTSQGIVYPIPAGVTRLLSSESGWGGFENGKVPSSAMAYSKRTGQGHPIAVKSWNELCDAAEKEGFDLHGSMYRSRESQAVVGAMGAPPGKSNHGWGLAIDISVLLGNYSKRYPGRKNSEMYTTPEYIWLWNNAYKFGWGHPDWAQQGGSKPEAWHWEFLAFKNFQSGSTQSHQGVNPHAGVNPFGAAGSGLQSMFAPESTQLFSAIAKWFPPVLEDESFESSTLVGYKALMNDEPVLVALDKYIRASGRSYCTAPNGDFISWFPDYWGEFGLAGAVEVESIELKDFSVAWSDESLITHQYVEGAIMPDSLGPMPGGMMNGMRAMDTRGVATLDMPNLLAAIINVKDSSQYPWLADPQLLLQRFGARVDRERNAMVYGNHQEFYAAVSKLTRAWASQFSASAPITFMPELYPGMLMRLPEFKVQMYVTSVTHSWDYNGNSGFTTNASTIAVSATEGSGFYLFPKGGDLRPTGSGGIGRSRLIV